jgi:glycosyltransferase involved in cell wall biosynthesis
LASEHEHAGSGTAAPRWREPVLLSVVAPVYNEEQTIVEFCHRVHAALATLPFELVLVDDGSTDSSRELITGLAERDEQIKLVVLSRNFGHQAALTAGLEHASGDVVVALDSDLQDPPELILEMLDRWRTGADVVYAVRRQRRGETRLKLATARWFYNIFRLLTGVALTDESGDYRLLDRRALQALLSMREHNRFLRGMSVWIGFDQAAVAYDRDPRYAGNTKYTPGRMLRFSADAIFSFSERPLQLATLLGFVISVLAFISIPVVLVLKFTGHYLHGFSTLQITLLLLGGIQLITIGIIGEYVSRIYDEVKNRPLYIVSSSVNVDETPSDGRDGNQGAEPVQSPPAHRS